MFRILVVEDQEGTLRQLKMLLSEGFPDTEIGKQAHIEGAGSVAEGRQKIEEAHRVKKPFHAVVLDFRLPEEPGTDVKTDESLCLLARELMPTALVAHITTYTEDEAVKDHLKRIHEEQVDPRSFALSKDAEFATKLVRRLKAFLYGLKVEEQLNALFGTSETMAFAARSRQLRPTPSGERSLTHALAAVTRDIEYHWHDLDERLQSRIAEIFRVDSSTNPVRISLLRKTEDRVER